MLLFWIAIFLFTFVLSLFLAARSMRGHQNPAPQAQKLDQALFLIRNSHLLTAQTLDQLYDGGFNFALERLFKGQEAALTIYGPKSLETSFAQLGLLELEDYLVENHDPAQNANKISSGQTLGWEVPIAKSEGIEDHFLKQLELSDNEQFFWQLVCQPVEAKAEEKQFGLTLRAMIAESDASAKIRLAKKIFTKINTDLGIKNQPNLSSNANLFAKYQLRIAEPTKIRFNSQELLKLLGY